MKPKVGQLKVNKMDKSLARQNKKKNKITKKLKRGSHY